MARQNGKIVTDEQKRIISKVLKEMSAEGNDNGKLRPKDMFR